ncbi:hypothetical protein Tdes44962_MAKER00216 [Teratosphaeria destructans]|uniref:Uncharacterized protein n=1 Tax=Teratosphaeria destructans TaxID=418781 RepID=A0A9W7SVF0_9PEZI|nr:hypothetical protein Tdes44962_MAKER00216 [Teratosphaeria destructans]
MRMGGHPMPPPVQPFKTPTAKMEPDPRRTQADIPTTTNPAEDPFDSLTFSQMKQCVVAYHGLKTDHDRINASLREATAANEQLEKESIMLKKENATLKKGKAMLLERVESAEREVVVRIKNEAELRTLLETSKSESWSEIGRLKERNARLRHQLDDAASAEDDRTTYLKKIQDLERSLAGKDSLLSTQQAEHERTRRDFSEHMEKLEAEREDLACQALRRSSEESQYLAAWLELTDSRDIAEHNSYQLALELTRARDEHLKTQTALSQSLEQTVAAERDAAHYKLEVCKNSKALEDMTGKKQWLSDAYESNRVDLNHELSSNRRLRADLDDELSRNRMLWNTLDQEREAYDTLRSDWAKLQQGSATQRSSGGYSVEAAVDADTKKRKRKPANGFRAGDAHLLSKYQIAYDRSKDEDIRTGNAQVVLQAPSVKMPEHETERARHQSRQNIPCVEQRKLYIGENDLRGTPEANAQALVHELYDRYKTIVVSIRGRILPRGVTMFVDKTKMHEVAEVDEHITEGVEEVVDAHEMQLLNETPWTITAHDQRPWVMDPEKGLVDPSIIATAASNSAYDRCPGGLDTPASPDEQAGGQLSITVPSTGTKNAGLQTPASPAFDSALDPITRAEASSNATAENTRGGVWHPWHGGKQDMDGDSLRHVHRQESRREKLPLVDRYVPEERDDSLFVSPPGSQRGCTPATVEVFVTTSSHKPAIHLDRAAPVAPKGSMQSRAEHAAREQPAPPQRPSSAVPAAYHEDLCQPQAPSRQHDKLPKRAWSDGPSNTRAEAASKRRRRFHGSERT